METNDIRNIGIMAHIDAGKTTTTERILFYTGENHKIGNVDDGNTTTDWMEQEKERGITIQSAAITAFWKNRQINIIDTPGHVDFTAEVERSLRVLDGAVAVFCAVGGVEAQSETVWKQSEKYRVPKIAFINKMDRMGADFHAVCKEIKSKLGATPVPMTIPVGSESGFCGVIDILGRKMLEFTKESQGSEIIEKEIPSDYEAEVSEYYDKLIEEASSFNDDIMEKYFQGESIDRASIIAALKKGTLERKILPVFAGSSLKNIGVQKLLDGIVDFLPSPLEAQKAMAQKGRNYEENAEIECSDKQNLAALVFKMQNDSQSGFLSYVRVYSGVLKKGVMIYNSTRNLKERAFRLLRMHAHDSSEVSELKAGDIGVIIGFKNACTGDTLCAENSRLLLEKLVFPSPVISVAIECKTTSDGDKLKNALEVLSHEDPTFVFKENEATGQVIISGMGELHLDVLVKRIKDEFHVDSNIGNPQVTYKESISCNGEEENTFERLINGKNVRAKIKLALSVNKDGDDYLHNETIISAKPEKSCSPEMLKAAKEQLESSLAGGIISGYECMGIKAEVMRIECDEGSPDFAVAGAIATCFDSLTRKLSPVLLEPVMNVTITTPSEFTGECISAVTSRSGIVSSMENKTEDTSIIRATAPLKNLFGFATVLRSSSQGKANFSLGFKSYSISSRTV